MLLESYDKPWDFELLDTGNGYRLEKWGEAILARPDPQIIWPRSIQDKQWDQVHAIFQTSRDEERGKWAIKKPLPSPWAIKFDEVKFLLKLSPFKHTGLFPEQAAQWEWMRKQIPNNKFQITNKIQKSNFKILNLFAYTGGATTVLAKAGCFVTHVDASKPALNWANENYRLNFNSVGAAMSRPDNERPIASPTQGNVRWILDDAVKFAKREVKRGVKYDGIIMDPPAFGHSPTGKTWKFNDDLPGLLNDCVQLLSDNAKFLIINGYATNSSALALNNLLEDATRSKTGQIEFGELCLKHPVRNESSNEAKKNSRMISAGIFARWSSS